MNKIMGIVLVAGLAMVAGCEDKKAPGKALNDAAKGAADATKGAVDATKDAAKGAVDAAKEKAADGLAAARDKAVATFKPLIDDAKTKLDGLGTTIAGLDAVKKAKATPLFEIAKTAFADLSGKFEALKGSTDGGASAASGVEGAMKTFTDALAKVTDAVK